jgi:hypothetical protein
MVSSQKLLELVMHLVCSFEGHFRFRISSLISILLNCYDLLISPTSYGSGDA